MAYSSLGTQWEGKLGHNPVFRSAELARIAEKHGRAIAQVVTSWLLQLGVVAIPRSTSRPHIEQLAAFQSHTRREGTLEVFLDAEDLRAIEQLDDSLGSLW